MASESLSLTFNSLKNRKSVCWHGEVHEIKRHWFTLKHAFVVLSAPNGSIVLDPWKTGGRDY